MRVALLTNFIPPYRKSLYTELNEGIEDFTIFISQHMEKNRHWAVDHGQLNVVVQKGFRYNKKWKSELGYSEKTVVQIPYDTFFKLRAYRPDIVISSELGIRSLLSAIYCKIYGRPLVLWLALSEHTESNKKGLRVFLRKRILKSAKLILCNGASAERYIKSLGIKKDICFTPYTSDFEINKGGSKEANTVKTVLFTGQLIPRKGIEAMVQALAKWAPMNNQLQIRLLVAGDGPEKTLIEQLDKFPNITLELLGNVPYHQLQNIYLQSHLYLFPTLADEWGVVVNEAMASGLPIVGSKYSQAAEELIEDGKNGWIFDPMNEQNFLDVFSQAIKCPVSELQSMGENGQKTVQNYTPKIVAQNILEALKFKTDKS